MAIPLILVGAGIRATAGPALRAAAQSMARTRGAVAAGTQQEKSCDEGLDNSQCNQCQLADGVLAPAKSRRNISDRNLINYRYQVYIANLHAGPEQFGFCLNGTSELLRNYDPGFFSSLKNKLAGLPNLKAEQLNVLEWRYNGVEFDGFWRQRCTVVDAKGRYAKHIDPIKGKPREGFPKHVMFPAFDKEMRRQRAAIASGMPVSKLEWHFMEKEVYTLAVKILALDSAVCNYTPLPAGVK